MILHVGQVTMDTQMPHGTGIKVCLCHNSQQMLIALALAVHACVGNLQSAHVHIATASSSYIISLSEKVK